jgi:hypothetical protein
LVFTTDCTQKSPLPEFYGFYLVEYGKLVEFKKSQEVDLIFDSSRKGIEINYSGLDIKDPNVYFIFYEKDIGKATDSLQIYKLVIVKRLLKWGLSSSYKTPPKIYELNKWLVTNESFRLKRKPVENRKDMIYLIPENPLKPGIYAINFGESFYDFSVNMDKYDKEKEALDRITEPGWAGWMKDKYVPYGQYAKLPIKIVDVKTMWVKSPYEVSSFSKTKIVPVIQFKIKNVTKNIIDRIGFGVRFKFKEGSKKLFVFSQSRGGIKLLPGEKTKNVFTMQSLKGVELTTKESFINNPDWKKVEVELFWYGNKSFEIPVGKFEIDHKIEDIGERDHKKLVERTILIYFQAMKHNDKGTMSSMAVEPKFLEFKSYKVLPVSEPMIEEYQLPGMLQKVEDAKKQRKEMAMWASEKRDEVEDLKDELSETRRATRKKELQKEIDEVEAVFYKAEQDFRNLVREMGELKRQIKTERMLVSLSTGVKNNTEVYEGEAQKSRVKVKITLDNGSEKIYVFTLFKHIFTVNERTTPSRFIISKIQSTEELEK